MQISVVVSWGPKLKEVDNSHPDMLLKVPMIVVLAVNSKNADTSRREGKYLQPFMAGFMVEMKELYYFCHIWCMYICRPLAVSSTNISIVFMAYFLVSYVHLYTPKHCQSTQLNLGSPYDMKCVVFKIWLVLLNILYSSFNCLENDIISFFVPE